MRGNWVAILFMASLTSIASAQRAGRITGTVLDEDGQLVDHADVCISITSGNSRSTNCLVSTDKDGHFHLENVTFGTYGILAANEREGYSISGQIPQDVSVTATSPAPDVIVRLRPKQAVLVGTVRDKLTGEPVKGIMVQYQDIDGKASGSAPLFSRGEFRVTVPEGCDLVIIVSAKGYHGWVYADPSNPSRPVLRLGPGEKKILDIQLEPTDQR
jgi:uncharacterized surface anchored protein